MVSPSFINLAYATTPLDSSDGFRMRGKELDGTRQRCSQWAACLRNEKVLATLKLGVLMKRKGATECLCLFCLSSFRGVAHVCMCSPISTRTNDAICFVGGFFGWWDANVSIIWGDHSVILLQLVRNNCKRSTVVLWCL